MSRVIKFMAYDGVRMQKVYAMHSNGIAALGDGGMVTDPEMIVQFSGLCDLNGTELYDGHIVKDAFEKLYVMIFDDKRASFVFKRVGYNIFKDVDELIVRIVGNIYENPELL